MPDAANTSRIWVRAAGGVRTIGFNDRRIMDEAAIAQIADELTRLVETPGGPLNLLLDFANVEHLSSAALGMLIILNINVRRRGGRVKMCRLRSELREVLEITRLNKTFEVYEDPDKAVADFQAAVR
jgi:anti-sigma B factor antagonist